VGVSVIDVVVMGVETGEDTGEEMGEETGEETGAEASKEADFGEDCIGGVGSERCFGSSPVPVVNTTIIMSARANGRLITSSIRLRDNDRSSRSDRF